MVFSRILFLDGVCVEFFIRIALDFQMELEGGIDVSILVIPRIPDHVSATRVKTIVMHTRQALSKDMFLALDLFLVFVGFLNMFVFRWQFQTRVLQLIGLSHVIRLLRLVKLVPQLKILIIACYDNVEIMVASVGLVYVTVYITAMIILLNSSLNDFDSDTARYWQSLFASMQTLLEMITFSQRSVYTDMLIEANFEIGVFTSLSVYFIGIGIINLIVGVWVQAAYKVVSKDTVSMQGKHGDDLISVVMRVVQDVFSSASSSNHKQKSKLRAVIKEMCKGFKGVKRNEILKERQVWLQSQSENDQANPQDVEEEVIELEDLDEGSSSGVVNGERGRILKFSCRIVDALWICSDAIAVSYNVKIERDENGPQKFDAWLTELAWIGDRRRPALHLAEKTTRDTERQTLDSDKKDTKRVQVTHYLVYTGTLIFRFVPVQYDYFFRFDNLLAEIKLSPLSVAGLFKATGSGDTKQHNYMVGDLLDSIRPVDKDYINVKQFEMFMDDTRVLDAIHTAELDVHEVLRVYQILDVLGEGRVRLTEFVSCLGRLGPHSTAIDSAIARCSITKLLEQLDVLTKESAAHRKTCTEIVQRLRSSELSSAYTNMSPPVESAPASVGGSIPTVGPSRRRNIQQSRDMERDVALLHKKCDIVRKRVRAFKADRLGADHLGPLSFRSLVRGSLKTFVRGRIGGSERMTYRQDVGRSGATEDEPPVDLFEAAVNDEADWS